MTGIFTTIVLTRDEDSWWRQGWLAQLAWHIANFFPWHPDTPLVLKLGIVVASTTIVICFILAAVQQFCLRILLSWTGWLYLPPRGAMPMKAKVWGVMVKICGGQYMPFCYITKPMTYSFKRMLPTLPLPDLEVTVRKYLATVKPLQDEAQFAETTAHAEQFLQGDGPTLQRYLNLKWLTSTNYISDWWEKYVYLRGRSSLMINSNYYALDRAWSVPTHVQEARAATCLYELLLYRRTQEREELVPLLIRGMVPLCMEQHVRAFSTSRIPGREADTLVHFEEEQSRHVVVLCQGSYYRMDVFDAPVLPGRMLEPVELEAALRAIKKDAADQARQRAKYPGLPQNREADIAALTAGNRTQWAEIREAHFAHGVNRQGLDCLESAILVLVLDDESPEDLTARGEMLLHGSGCNRWFDKSLCLVAFANGTRREPFNFTPMGVNPISPGPAHVRPMGVHRTCGA